MTIPEGIRSLLTEACSLEHCPESVRSWCVEVMSTESLPWLPVINATWGHRYWALFVESLYNALDYLQHTAPGSHFTEVRGSTARQALDDIIELYPLREAYVEHPP